MLYRTYSGPLLRRLLRWKSLGPRILRRCQNALSQRTRVASCHLSNALPGTGFGNIKPLTTALHGSHASVTDPITGGPINPGQAFGAIPNQKETFKELQPKLSLRYGLTDDLNFYANWGIGFKSGGFNNQGSAAIVDQNFNQFLGTNVLINDIYRKETSSAFEAGFKGSAANRALTFDLAGH